MQRYISLREELDLEAHRPLSATGCQKIKDAFAIDDQRSETVTSGHAFFFQFWAHQWTDSTLVDGKFHNRYNFQNDGQGIYPIRDLDANLIDRATGKFVMLNGGLPQLKSDNRSTETAPDNHRANENKILTAFHLFAVKLHNKLIDEFDIDYVEAKRRVRSIVSKMTLHESLKLTGFDEYEFFNDIRTKDMHKTLEFNFGLARWAHAQMPSTVNGKAVFDRTESSAEVDLVKLFDGSEKARVLNLGVSKEMTEMMHIPQPQNILDRTFGKNNDLGLLSANELSKVTGFDPIDFENDLPQMQGIPLWPYVLLEAGFNGEEGTLGPRGARWIADGIAQIENWGFPGQGVWCDFDIPNPNDEDYSLNAIKYAMLP